MTLFMGGFSATIGIPSVLDTLRGGGAEMIDVPRSLNHGPTVPTSRGMWGMWRDVGPGAAVCYAQPCPMLIEAQVGL